MYSKISKQFSDLTPAAEAYPVVSKAKESSETELAVISHNFKLKKCDLFDLALARELPL